MFTVEALVHDVLAGKIRVPKFHRPIHWELRDVLDLLDSLYRGYPIGTLLLWQRPAAADRLVHGSVVIDAPPRHDALWVVDGQQRSLSLTRVFAGAGFPEEPFAAFFDAHRLAFVRPARRETPPSHYVPLTEVLDPERLAAWLADHEEAASDRQAVIRLGENIREYQVPAYVLATEDERSVREIFRRAHKTGKQMNDSDVFNALHHALAGPAPASLGDVAASLAALNFGPLEDSTLYDMLLAARGADQSRNRLPELSSAEAHRAMQDLERSARATITFLRDDVGIPHISLLPYQQPLLALARLFHRHPQLHPRSRDLLRRWLWRGAITGAHSGTAIQTRQMLSSIGDDEHRAVQALLGTVPSRCPGPVQLEEFNFRDARCKIELLALLQLRPLDLRSGEPVDAAARQSWSAEPDEPDGGAPEPVDRAVYERLVRPICLDATELQRSLANRMLHPGLRGGLARAVVACEDPAILASHAISPEARRALEFDRHHEFLRMRRDALASLVHEFTDQRAAWGELDFPPVEAARFSDD